MAAHPRVLGPNLLVVSRGYSNRMPRIEGIDPASATGYAAKVFESQTTTWGAPLLNHRIYARRPALLKAVRGMWLSLDSDRVLGTQLVALLNRRVAALNGCVF